jgi:hypothetical protein
MSDITSQQLTRLRKDVNILRASIEKLRFDALGKREADEEFLRLWPLYDELRDELVNLDTNLFGKLRQLQQPPTEKPQGYGERNVVDRDYVKPLFNEIIRASEYLEILEQSFAKEFGRPDTFSALRLLAQRFHNIARQLRNRYSQRATIDVEDEYDVQDLLHALLRLYFDDIRPEEWTPSYAGKSARMDFLIKAEKLVIETKKTRKGLDAKELGDQLIVDIQRYQAHPNCKTLFCFVYDPEGKITNPMGIEADLSKTHNDIDVIVVIEPK